MLFISLQNPVTSGKEISRLLAATKLLLDLNVKLIKCTWNFFSHDLANPDRYI